MNRASNRIAAIALAVGVGAAVSCAESTADVGLAGAGPAVAGDAGDDGYGSFGEGSRMCTGLQCQVVDCGASGQPATTLSGVVYDPAGKMPLYDVYVYVPNAPLDPIQGGNPACTQCQALASGYPIVGALTDASGRFVLTNVPSGDDIPLVIQVGKWRRKITIAHVAACTDNPQTDRSQTRLPAKSSEGDMPLIALTTGCDTAECFLRDLGIDDSEFVAPGAPNGHVQIFQGQSISSLAEMPNVVGGYTYQQTYAWWRDPNNLLKYDIILNGCECDAFDRNEFGSGGDAYQAMQSYLEGGGRLFATHYFYNWFAPPTGPADFQSVADWDLSMPTIEDCPSCFVDTTFPKGKAFADWLQNSGVTSTYAQVGVVDTRDELQELHAGATRWIYSAQSAGATPYQGKYMSFNAPIGATTDKQCGRAVFSNIHLAGGRTTAAVQSTTPPTPPALNIFPSECGPTPQGFQDHTKNEQALEFLFFDLSTCVQDDSKPPPTPTR